jgi:hypothetical protein
MDLSVSFLDWVGSEQRASLESDTAKGMCLRDYLNKGKIKSLKKLKNGISFEDDGNKMFISELARGDYDGDDYEDALIYCANYYIGGSGRYYTPYIVKRNITNNVCVVEDFDFH